MVRKISELMVSKEILWEYICNQERKNIEYLKLGQRKRSTGDSMNTEEIRQIAVQAKDI